MNQPKVRTHEITITIYIRLLTDDTMGPPKPKPQMANPATSNHPVRQPAPWDAVKITNRPNGIAGALGFKRVIFTLNGVDSEPIWDVPADDPLTTLQAGERVEAYFKSLDEVKQLIITSIDVRLDDMLDGYYVTINTEEWIDQGFVADDPSTTDPNAACFKPIPDIENIIYDCDCPGFKKGNGVAFDSQDAYEQEWTSCPCCNEPFKTRTSKSASYATPPIATTATSASYLPQNDLVIASTQSSKIKFGDLITEAIKSPEFKEYIAQIVKEQKGSPDPYKSGGSGPYDD